MLLLGVVLLARPAGAGAAECGRHVLWSNGTGEAWGRVFEGGSLDAFGQASEKPEVAAPIDKPKPCNGALCSGNPGVPHAPSTVPADRLEQWSLLLELHLQVSGGSLRSQPVDDSARPIRRAGFVFHPPR